MAVEYGPVIEALKKTLEEAERKPAALRLTINTLCEQAGLPKLYADPVASSSTTQGDSQGQNIQNIGTDTFFGKKQQTAVREYLEMRKRQGQGPATPREIFEALTAGGFPFEAKTDEIALVGIRSLLRKRYLIFQKLPNGRYGLTSWYPEMKAKKPQNQTADPQDNEESADE